MYAKDKAENSDEQPAKSEADVVKAAKDVLKRIKMPTNTGPTYAGQTDISSEQASTSILDENTPKVEETPELNKCGMIPGTDNAQRWENEKARHESRPAQRISAVPGVKRQIVPNIYNPPPMAMSAQSGNSAPKPASAQSATPANDAANKLIKNTIGNFGPLSASGNLNGNAAFGVKNSPNSSKTSNYRTNEKSARISAPMCPCGCGEKSYNCTCPKWCTCRNPGMPCAPKKRKANTKTDSQNQKKAEAPQPGKVPLAERMIDGLLQTNKTHRNINTAVSAVSPMLLNSLGKYLGFGVGPTLSLGANLGHAGVAHGLNMQQKMLQDFKGLNKQNSAITTVKSTPRAAGQNDEGGMKSAGLYGHFIHAQGLNPQERKFLQQKAREVAKFRQELYQGMMQDDPQYEFYAGGSPNFRDDVIELFQEKYPDANVWPGNAVEFQKFGPRRWLGLRKGKQLPVGEGYAVLMSHYPKDIDPTKGPTLETYNPDFDVETDFYGDVDTSVHNSLSDMTGGRYQFSAPTKTMNPREFGAKVASSPAWQRAAGQNDEGGLNAKGRASYNNATGGNLKAPVTESNPKGERKSRRSSFCARMGGMKKKLTGKDTASDPDSRINKALRKWNCKSGEEKNALDVARGGIGSRALASTLGHLGAFPIMTILEPHSHINPTQWAGEKGILDSKVRSNDARGQKHVQLAEDMARANPEELKDTRIYLGGPNLFSEYGRLFTNPRTSLLGKTHGALSLPINTLMATLMRGSQYNPYTNSVALMGDSPAVLSHEIGHAIDFNSGGPVPKYEPGKSKIKTWLQRQGKGLQHDAYTIGRMLPVYGGIHALHQEERANTLSRQNLERTYAKDSDKLNDILDKRQRILPAGMGSYIGGAAAGMAGPFGGLLQTPFSIGGAIGGKIYGMQEAARRNKKYVPDNKSDSRSEEKEEEEEDKPKDTIKIPERKEKTEDKDKEELKKAAKQLGLWDRIRAKKKRGGKPAKPGDKDYPDAKSWKKVTSISEKKSAYKGISEFSGMPGPDQISHAVSQLGMLKALVRPDDSALKQRGITRSGFQSGLRDIYNHSRNKDRFEFSELAPQPNTHAALGGLGGLGAAGLLGYAGVRDPAILAGTAVIPAVAAYFRARNKRHNLLNTAKLVKDYGLLRPKLLRQAYPLLAADE